MTLHLRHHTQLADQRARDGTYRAEDAPGNADKIPELMLALLMAESQPKKKPRFTYNKGRVIDTQRLVMEAMTRPMPLGEIVLAADVSITAGRSALRKAFAQGRVKRKKTGRGYIWAITNKGLRYLDEKKAVDD